MNAATRWRLFCAVSPRLESLLEAELSELPEVRRLRRVQGGCELQVSPTGLWTVLLRSRLTESARVRIGAFRARTFDHLHAGLAKLPWAAWLPRCSTPEVRVACKKSKLWHSGAVEERVTRQIHERLSDAKRPDAPAPPAARVYVRIDHDNVHVSVDASGELLHRRGERTAVGKAPMRETLAAAVVRASGLGAEAVVWDPFCGSGTLLIEAARRHGVHHTNRPDGYAFERWPSHDAARFAAWLAAQQAEAEARHGTLPAPMRLLGSDHDAHEVAGARTNLAAAGLAAQAELRACDFSEMAADVPKSAVVVSNLPYGRRAKVGDVFKRFGRLLRERPDLDAWLLLGHPSHAQAMKIPAEPVLRFKNGGLRVGLYHRAPRR